MTNDERNSILKKVQALMAKADENQNDNEAEREIAMKKALALLAKHNMTLADASTVEDELVRIVQPIRHGPWARYIFQSIARLYFCEALFFSRRDNSKVVYYGKELDAKIAHEIAYWVQESFWKEGLKVKREFGGHNCHLTSFLNMASRRISARCLEIIQSASIGNLDDGTGSTMLVPMSVYEQAWSKARDQFPDNVSKINSKQEITSYGAAMRGRDAADKINLGRQIAETGRNQQMIGK
jgi:hypothetical protein